MYKIFADNTLIYDSTIDDYKIGGGSINLEVNKSGSFVFTVYPDNIFYNSFVKLKTVITVYKSGKIVFRGRILNDVTDYWNNKNITCEGELGFLQDSIIRPFTFTGSPEDLLTKFIEEHNAQVDDFKKFKIGTVTVVNDSDLKLNSTGYSETFKTLTDTTIDSDLGGYLYITHGEDGTDPIPTINYLADFTVVSSQPIEFGSNLKEFTKTVKAEDMATAIIPFGMTIGNNERLTIKDVNDGVDYIYSESGVNMYGWIFKTVVWDDVNLANNLKRKAEEYLNSVVNQSVTIELNAVDLHLLDHSIESFNVCEYVRVKSDPHNLDTVLLCSKQTIDLLKPENDTVVLGYQSPTFTGNATDMSVSISKQADAMSSISQKIDGITLSVENGEDSSTITIMSDGVEIDSANISFTGVATFEGLASGMTTIDGACIKTGTIDAERLNLTGAIMWSHLNANAQAHITDAEDLADEAYTLAHSAETVAKQIADGDYTGGTFIDGKMIYSPEIYANEFNIYPESKTNNSGSFNLYSYYNKDLYHMLKVEYDRASSIPHIDFDSPAGAYARWMFGKTLFEGLAEFFDEVDFNETVNFNGVVDFSNATVIGL